MTYGLIGTAGEHLNRILCAADPAGSVSTIERLLAAADDHDVDAIALLGDLGDLRGERTNGYSASFHALARASRPVFWVPGAADVPFESYLREAFNIETAFPSLRGVHGTAAATAGGALFAGLEARSTTIRVGTAMSSGGSHIHVGRRSTASRCLVSSTTTSWRCCSGPPRAQRPRAAGQRGRRRADRHYRPRVAVCSGDRNVASLGRSTTVAPGSLRTRHYAVADLRERAAQVHELQARSRSRAAPSAGVGGRAAGARDREPWINPLFGRRAGL
jgi:hypothetical protein